MNKEQLKLTSNVCVFLKKENKVLLGKRKNSNWMNGFYALPGGKIDDMEDVFSAAIREVKEEIGVEVKKQNLKVIHVLHLNEGKNLKSVSFFLETKNWDGNPKKMEPEKCEKWFWSDLENLPINTVENLKFVLKQINKNNFFSEFGWENEQRNRN